MFSDSDSDDDDDDESTREDSRSINLLMLESPSQPPPLPCESSNNNNNNNSNNNNNNNNNSPSSVAEEEESVVVFSPATQTINQLSQSSQNTSLHYNMSQLEQDVNVLLAAKGPSAVAVTVDNSCRVAAAVAAAAAAAAAATAATTLQPQKSLSSSSSSLKGNEKSATAAAAVPLFLKLDNNFSLYQIEITCAGTLGLKITRFRPPYDLVQSLKQYNNNNTTVAVTAQQENNGDYNNDDDDHDDNDDDATVDEADVELQNACHVELVRESSLAASFGIEANDWFVQMTNHDETNHHHHHHHHPVQQSHNSSNHHHHRSTSSSSSVLGKKISFLSYNNVRTMARQTQRPITFLVARQNNHNTNNNSNSNSNNNSNCNPVTRAPPPLMTRPTQSGAAVIPRQQQQQQKLHHRGGEALEHDSSNKALTSATGPPLLERRRQDTTKIPQQQQQQASTIIGLKKNMQSDDTSNISKSSTTNTTTWLNGGTTNQNNNRDKKQQASLVNTLQQQGPSSLERGPRRQEAKKSVNEPPQQQQQARGKNQASANTLQASMERPRQEAEKSVNEPQQQQQAPRQIVLKRKDIIDASKSYNMSNSTTVVPKSGPNQVVKGPVKDTQHDVTTADVSVPFCIKCNNTDNNKNINKHNASAMIHHAWCPKHGQFHNSGADVILERLRMGLRLGCPTCTKELESGRLFGNARHTQACMKNQERLKYSSNALVKKQESLDNKKQKAHSSSSKGKGKRKSSNDYGAKKTSSMSRKKKEYDFSDTSNSSSEDEPHTLHRGPRKRNTGTTKQQRGRSTARGLSDGISSDDDSDESMYMDDSHGKRRRPMQTLLAIKKQKQRKDSRAAERANHVTPNETICLGQTESSKNGNAHAIATAGKRRISSRSDDEDDVVYDDAIDDNEPITSVWKIDDNPWGPEGHMDGDVVLYAPQIDVGNCDMLLPSNRYKSDPFSANSQYCKTHQTPTEGFQLLILTRDIMSRNSWGFSCYLHEFGGACLVKHVDPMSPADTASLAGQSGSNGTELGLRPNDMIIAVNGKLTGGMGEVELQIVLETTVCELLLVVSRYKFAHQGMDKIEEAERSLLAAVDDAMNDEHLLGWIDMGNRVTTAETSRGSGRASLPPRNEPLEERLGGSGNATDGELEQPSNNVDKMPLGNGTGGTGEHDKTLKNDTDVSGDKSSNVETDTRSSPERRLLAASSSSDCMERTDDPSAHVRIDSPTQMRNGESRERHSPSRHGGDRHSVDAENHRMAAFEQNFEEEQSDISADEKDPVTFGPLVAALTECGSTSNRQERFSALSQYTSSRGSHGSANDDETDDGYAWCGCVCGMVHPKKIPVYWIQCGACMTWYNVSRTCVGFDCDEAESLEHWECWACKDPDESLAESTEQECTPNESQVPLREQTEIEETILPRDAQQQLQSKEQSNVPLGDSLLEEQQITEADHNDQQNSISNDRTQLEPASGALEDFTSTAVDSSDQQTQGRYSIKVSNDRIAGDGSIQPRTAPRQTEDGTYTRPVGRVPAGCHWDETRGVYAPDSQPQPASGALEDGKMTAVASINQQTKGHFIPPDRWTADGCILSKSKPKQRPDGTFIRTMGPGIVGFRWDEIRGVYAPDSQPQPASGALEDGKMTAVASINQQTKGHFIPPDRWTADGCILSKSKPKQRPDGTFIRTMGPGIVGFRWDEIRGVYEPIKNITTAIVAAQKKGTTGKQRNSDGCSSQRSQSLAQQRRLRPGRHVSAASVTTSSPGHNLEEGMGNNNNLTLDDEVMNEGDHVFIKEHAWPGVNNPAGIAVVLKSYNDEDGDRLYDVKYIIGRKKIGILARFVSHHVF